MSQIIVSEPPPPSYEEAIKSPRISSYQSYNHQILSLINEHANSENNNMIRERGRPTLKQVTNFNCKTDAKILQEIFQNHANLNKNLLIDILCHRNMEQRMEISKIYYSANGVHLIKEMKKYLNSNFYKLMSGLVLPYHEFLARTIHNSDHSFRWLFYILFTLPNDEIRSMKRYFESKYKIPVETFITNKIDLDDERRERIVIKPIIKMLEANRDESTQIDMANIYNDIENIKQINGSIFDNTYNNKEIIKNIFYNKNFSYIKKLYDEYIISTNGQSTLNDAIKKAFTYSLSNEEIFQCIIKYSLNKDYYYAYLLKKSMKKLGTNNKLLINVVVRHFEIDMYDIKVEFNKLYDDSLREWIKNDTSGHYKYALYELIGEQRSNKH